MNIKLPCTWQKLRCLYIVNNPYMDLEDFPGQGGDVD